MISSYRFGILAELVVYIIYLFKFYRPISRRHRNIYGEIDLIFVKGKTLIFIEVKARRSSLEYDVIHPSQIKRIKNAAMYFINLNPRYINYDMRFDLAIITYKQLPIIMMNITL